MFSTVISAFFSISLTSSSPRGDLRLIASDFLLALNMWKYHGSSSGLPGCSRRPGSPVAGFSILTTSAPSQASDSVHDGPASNWVKSTTRTPSRQSSSTPRFAIAISSHAASGRHRPLAATIAHRSSLRKPVAAQDRPSPRSYDPAGAPKQKETGDADHGQVCVPGRSRQRRDQKRQARKGLYPAAGRTKAGGGLFPRRWRGARRLLCRQHDRFVADRRNRRAAVFWPQRPGRDAAGDGGG